MGIYLSSAKLSDNHLSYNVMPKTINKGSEENKNTSHVIAVTSGKGGVGKTNFVVNIALELGLQGFSVTLLDADLALGNADLLLGVTPTYNLGHVISGERRLKEIIYPVAPNVSLIPASSGLERLVKLSQAKRNRLVNDLKEIENNTNFILIDTPAGIGSNVISFLCAASDVVVVTMPEPTAIIDAYATIKVLHKYSPNKRVWVAVNNVTYVQEAEEVFEQLAKTAHCFLKHKIGYLGAIPRDPELLKAVKSQIPVVEYSPTVPSSRSFRIIAKRLHLMLGMSSKTPSFIGRSLTEPNLFEIMNEGIC
ncbi:MAG: ATPase involved in chromosome partitioning [bacterium]|nr:MAG: ATPase involved in chromosome partitioning [bacterium]